MGSLTSLMLAAACLALVGCGLPGQSRGGDRAIEVYRQQLRRAGARSFRADFAPPEGRAAPESLTADEAVALAKGNSAGLAALAARVEVAAALVAVAQQIPNPEVQVSQLRADQILDGKARERTSLHVPIPRPGEIEAKVAAARADEAGARAALRAAELAVEMDIRWLFDDVLLLDQQIAAADSVLAARTAVAAQMKGRLEASEATLLDTAMAEVTAVEAEEDRVDLVAQRSASRSELLERIGVAQEAPVRIVGDPPDVWPPPPLPDEQTLVEAALQNRPEIESAAARIDASDARLFAERVKRWPWLTYLEVGYEVAPGIPAGLGWTFQGGVEVPIFNTNRAGVVAADAAQNAAKLAFIAQVEVITRDVRASLRAARVARTIVTDLRKDALPANEHATAAIKQALAGQNIDVIGALMVDVRRARVEFEYLRAIRRYRAAVSDLRRATGGPISAAPAGEHGPSTPPVQRSGAAPAP